MTTWLEVIGPGVLSTVQDLGRQGLGAVRQLEVDLEVIDFHQRRRARRLGRQSQASQGVGASLVGGVARWRQAGGGAGG